MSLQLLADSDIALASLEAVDGADVVETTTGHKAARRCVSTGHDPAGSQGDSMDLYTGGRGGGESKLVNLVLNIATPHTMDTREGY